jgi:hypothetical protein
VSLARYSLAVLLIVAGSLALVFASVGSTLDAAAREAAVAGGALAAANAIAAYFIVLWSERRSTNVFLGAVLGGMVGRMGILLGAVVAAVVVFGLPKVPLALSLLAYFVVFLVMELAILQKKTAGAVR